MNSMKFLNRRMPGSGRGGRADEDMRSTVKQLSARSWKFLLDDNLWGTPVIDTSEGKVWKHRLPSDAYGAANSVVKAKGLVAATPEAIFEMIFDSSRTKEYNKYSVGRADIDTVAGCPKSKIVWNRTNPPGTKKPHDFCTLMHGVSFPAGNGTYLIMTTAVEHPKAKPSSNYLRSEILLGVNLMKPVPGRAGVTELTTVNHVKTTGVPAFLSEKVAAKSAIDFIRKVDTVLGGKGNSAMESSGGDGELSDVTHVAPASTSGRKKSRRAIALNRIEFTWGE